MSFSCIRTNALDTSMYNAINFGRNGKGCVLVAGTGNKGKYIWYPATSPYVIAVGAIVHNGERANFSCYGNELSVVAPGLGIPTTDLQGDYGLNYITNVPNDSAYTDYTNRDYTGKFNGTSSACPHVAGVAALMLSVNPNLTQQEVRDIIEKTAQKVRTDLYDYKNYSDRPNGHWHEEVGYGIVNACAAVAMAMDTTCGVEEDDITKYYFESICRSANNRFSNIVLKPNNVDNFSGAKWYIGSIDDENNLKATDTGSFNLSNYIDGYPGADYVDVYLVLPSDGVKYRWRVNIVDASETLTEYYANNPDLGVQVSSDGTFGTIFLNKNSALYYNYHYISMQCPYYDSTLVFVRSNTSLEVDNENSYVSIPYLYNISDSLYVCFRLKDAVCYETIKMKTKCKNCSEMFTFHIYNEDLLRPEIDVTHNCVEGNATITANIPDNCGNLETI